MQQVVPVLGLRDAEAGEQLGVIDQPVGLENGAGPEALGVLQGDGFRLADTRRNRVHHGLGQIELGEQLLLGELVEERALAAPEDVGVGPALPLHDAAVGHRRAGGQGARFHVDVPSFLGVPGEVRQCRIGQGPRDRRDEDQLVFDLLRGGRSRSGERHEKRRAQRPERSNHDLPLLKGMVLKLW
jgi:hypothetical protein